MANQTSGSQIRVKSADPSRATRIRRPSVAMTGAVTSSSSPGFGVSLLDDPLC